MWIVTNLLLCSFVVVVAQAEVELKPDRPSLVVMRGEGASLQCCYTTKLKTVNLTWIKHGQTDNKTLPGDYVKLSENVVMREPTESDPHCGTLTFKSTQPEDSGLYQCVLNISGNILFTHGTYLQVYKPLEKTINLPENTKNKILAAEGVLLLLCVLLPATTLLCQSKRVSDLERKKSRKEEENIYQGLNLDDCSATYDQIERSQAHGPYQDVCNIMEEEEEEIQLEKP